MQLSLAAPPVCVRATPAYWFTMLAASALGTNLGDFGGETLGLGEGASFAVLAALAALAIALHARRGAGYWLAIVMLRAAATNVADTITHAWALGYIGPSLVLAAATLGAGALTREAGTVPRIDGRYWGAMLLAGIFGTVAGDLASHTMGVVQAAGLLVALTAGAVAWRGAAVTVLSYWAVVLTERCAGTPLGDAIAGGHGAGLGVPAAMLCTGALFLAGLLLLRRGR